MIDRDLLEILACPETRQVLRPASEPLTLELNARVEHGLLRDRSGRTIERPFESLLVRADGKFAYPVRDAIAELVVEAAIPLPADVPEC